MIINLGDAPFKAFIKVTYPKGTCTVSGNGQTYTHSGGGTVTFTVKKKGTYTVKGVYSSSVSTSKSVSITERNQVQTVSITYEVVFFNNGSKAYSAGWTGNRVTYGSTIKLSGVNDSTNGTKLSMAYASSGTINLTDIKTLQITASVLSNCTGRFIVDTTAKAQYSWSSSHISATYYADFSSTGTKSINVSSLSGAYYMSMSAVVSAGKTGTFTVTKIVGIIS